jgi:hypothetical protein
MFPVAAGWMVGLAGLEPATPRLSSVCSNQLSYRPGWVTHEQDVIELSTGGGMRIRTADILLAKQTLYQLSYTPVYQGGANDEEKRLNCALRYLIAQIF